ncbi:MAG: 2,3-bisphosphoglycerate-independent phosphoglycerate mutase [Planctomycetota bacterium]
MKYAVVIPAGAVDEPVPELDGRTPLQAAEIPALDRMAATGQLGTAVTIPPGYQPRGEIGVLSVFGYDPKRYPLARGPLEAYARGMEHGPADRVFRCSLVTLAEGRMQDIHAGGISTTQASQLLEHLNAELADPKACFYAGQSYRNLFVWRDAGPLAKLQTTDPQGLIEQPIRRHLPRGADAEPLRRLIRWSQRMLEDHEINQVRRDLNENPANAVWVYGQGHLPDIPRFAGRFGVRGALVAGVDMVRGLARRIGWRIIDTPGATGLPDTDYAAKGRAAIAALDEYDLICVHIEAPDEAGHAGDAFQKVASLEAIDSLIVEPLHQRLLQESEYRILVIPSHATPVKMRAHSANPSIFVMAGSDIGSGPRGGTGFDESEAINGKMHVEPAAGLMEHFIHVKRMKSLDY